MSFCRYCGVVCLLTRALYLHFIALVTNNAWANISSNLIQQHSWCDERNIYCICGCFGKLYYLYIIYLYKELSLIQFMTVGKNVRQNSSHQLSWRCNLNKWEQYITKCKSARRQFHSKHDELVIFYGFHIKSVRRDYKLC